MDASSTRDRLVSAMSDALQRRGMNGIGLTELLGAARAPKGVLYHHFPGGKSQLTVAAIDAIVQRMLARLDAVLSRGADPIGALRVWIGGAQKQLGASDFERGCPLATVALESTADDIEIRAALAAGFRAIRARLGAALAAQGLPSARAEGLAALIVSAYEGGLLQSRVEGSVRPMRLAVDTLLDLLEPLRPTGPES